MKWVGGCVGVWVSGGWVWVVSSKGVNSSYIDDTTPHANTHTHIPHIPTTHNTHTYHTSTDHRYTPTTIHPNHQPTSNLQSHIHSSYTAVLHPNPIIIIILMPIHPSIASIASIHRFHSQSTHPKVSNPHLEPSSVVRHIEPFSCYTLTPTIVVEECGQTRKDHSLLTYPMFHQGAPFAFKYSMIP